MSRRGNPQAESFIKTLKVEDAYLLKYETFKEAAAAVPRFIDEVDNTRRLHSARSYLSPVQFETRHTRTPVKSAA